jgi:hypothetical protein
MALDPVTAGIDAVREIGGSLIKHFFPDPAQQAEAEQKMAELEKSGDLQAIAGQLSINQEEAKSTNWFVAGWRPFVGWTCGFALLYAAILDPMARFRCHGHPQVCRRLPGHQYHHHHASAVRPAGIGRNADLGEDEERRGQSVTVRRVLRLRIRN